MTMTTEMNIYELTSFRVFQRVYKPQDFRDEIPDPGREFNKCTAALNAQVITEMSKAPNNTTVGQQAYFHAQARDALKWCFDNRVPHAMTQKVQSWLLAV